MSRENEDIKVSRKKSEDSPESRDEIYGSSDYPYFIKIVYDGEEETVRLVLEKEEDEERNEIMRTVPVKVEDIEAFSHPHPNSHVYKRFYGPVLRELYKRKDLEGEQEFKEFVNDFMEWDWNNYAIKIEELIEGYNERQEEKATGRRESPNLSEEKRELAEEFLNDPEIFKRVLDKLSLTVKEDLVGKALVLTVGLSTYNREPLNLFLTGPPSIGKSHLVTNVLNYFPPEDIIFLGGMSKTALKHEPGEWDEERKAKIVDVENKIFVFLEAPEKEVFEQLLPLLSHDKWEISFKTTERPEGGSHETEHTIIRGWPATVFLTYKAKYFKALSTRGFKYTPEMTKEKYDKGQKLTAEQMYEICWEDRIKKETDILSCVIRMIKEFSNEKHIRVKIPYSFAFQKNFVHEKGEDMRTFNQIMYLNQALTLLYFKQSLYLEHEEKDRAFLVAGPEPYNASKGLIKTLINQKRVPGYLQQFYNSVLKRTEEKHGQKIVDAGGNERIGILREDIQKVYFNIYNERIGKSTLSEYMTYLEDAGQIYQEEYPKNRTKKIAFLFEEIQEDSSKTFDEPFEELYPPKAFRKWLEICCSRHPLTYRRGGNSYKKEGGKGQSVPPSSSMAPLSNNCSSEVLSQYYGGESEGTFDELSRTNSKPETEDTKNVTYTSPLNGNVREHEVHIPSISDISQNAETEGDASTEEEKAKNIGPEPSPISPKKEEEADEWLQKIMNMKRPLLKLYDIIDEINTNGSGAEKKKILIAMKAEGISKEKTEELIKYEKQRGGIYEPKNNHFKVV